LKPRSSKIIGFHVQLQDFHNDKDRREFISAGTAAGLAAAFGAPIGGVLFSLEEASSFWSRKVMWRSLLCTSCATMVLSWLNKRDFSLSLPGSLSFHGLRPEFSLHDLPLFVVTSGAAGLLGACLNTAHGWLSQLRPSSRHRLLRFFCLVLLINLICRDPCWFLGACNETIFLFFLCFHGYLHFSLSFYQKNSRAVAYQKWN
jgi:H+/Cl- antiporter ClcA